MSKTNSEDPKQDRRQWLKTSATILGTSLLPIPSVASVLQSNTAPASSKQHPHETNSAARFLTPAEYVLVAELAETIIPADSQSGGAKAAKVADFIEQRLREYADDARQSDFKEGLHLVDLMSLHQYGKSFVDSGPEDKIAVLTVLFEHREMTELVEVRFFRDLKDLTIEGYYTSKIGIHDDLEYKGNVALMEYVGCDDPHTEST
jgi:hypothetical protein